jgi:hypothetical protein
MQPMPSARDAYLQRERELAHQLARLGAGANPGPGKAASATEAVGTA